MMNLRSRWSLNQGTVLPKQMAHCNVPLELWRKIFILACTDGGFTGISLALVSKPFHAASLPVRLHSLAFTSLRQVEGFLSFIEAQRDVLASHGGPRIHHLLLKGAESPSPSPFYDNIKTPEDDQKTAANADASPSFPSLRRLHILSSHWDRTFERLPMLAPILSHLRISNTGDSGIPEALRAAIGMSSPSYSGYIKTHAPPGFDPTIRPSYPSLQQIIVRMTPPPPGGFCGNPYIQYGDLVHTLESMGRACREQPEGVQVIAFSGRRHFTWYWEKRAQKDWLERMTGGRGCWVPPKQLEGKQLGVEHYDDSDDDLC
ncbi:hypothetical protein A0H81_13473 [Grifola frondosa]|uniref:Uncharacterized protein n=1 Tax=Grifola frondosa TaxID=5627 RepID=A0A1C7LPJ5_GRIFR|nr:hypothetical protein A0H81_13473 [Grifola frondosa]